MAKTNKYTSINFNDIYDRKISSSPATGKQHPYSSAAAQKSCYLSAASRSHGMLVLSRPSPKPIAQPQSAPSSLPSISRPSPKPIVQPQSAPSSLPSISPAIRNPPPPMTTQSVPEHDSISLRPLGKTGPGLEAGKKESVVAAIATPKSDKFIPPHLRPGFVAKEERPPHFRPGSSGGIGSASSPSRYGEDRRPKSGGYGRRGYLESGEVNRPRSGGNRPNSSG